MTSILSVGQVSKQYGAVRAVDRVSFAVRQGRIFGLLGPNGAGKTSTIRMITYITVPDSGTITFQGKNVGPWSQDRMGYLPEERGLYKKMKVGEQLVYLSMLKGMTRQAATDRIRYWLDRFDARSWVGKKTQELSKGMQQKIQFISTIAHDPDLLIFDEPFSGLDPINSDLLREVILELKEKGKTILFASHRMEQVEQMCDDICLISEGRAILNGGLREIKRSFGRDTAILEFEGSESFLDSLAERFNVRIAARSNNHAELRLTDPSLIRPILQTALDHVDVYRFELVEPSLNEIFISSVGADKAKTMQTS
jgi:ABC-2 type transport system ATP-binding protein